MPDFRRLRILISRLSAIGDCILTVPVLNALRDHFPNAFLAWIVERPTAPLLEGHSALDELIVVPRGCLKSPKTVWQLRRRLRRLQFDITIDPQSLTKSAVLARLSGARQRIGFSGEDGRELSRWLNNELISRSAEHMVDRRLELLEPLGISNAASRFELPIYEAASEAMRQFLSRSGGGDRFALINVGAGWPSKLWPAEGFGVVASHLSRTHGMPSVVIWAGEQERDWAQRAVETAAGTATLAPQTSLTELAELARRAVLFVGCDTGPMHISAAVDTPCVALFGPTLPSVCGPYGEAHLTVQAFHQKSVGSRQQRNADNLAMRAIQTSDVCKACDTVVTQIESPATKDAA